MTAVIGIPPGPTVRIDIRSNVLPPNRPLDVRSLEDLFQEQLNNLAKDLKLPSNIEGSIVPGEKVQPEAAPRYRISINGKPCRLDRLALRKFQASESTLVCEWMRQILENRVLLVDRALVDYCCRIICNPVEGRQALIPEPELETLLQTCIERGFDLDSALAVAASWSPATSHISWTYRVEADLSCRFQNQVGLEVSPRVFSLIGDAPALEVIVEANQPPIKVRPLEYMRTILFLKKGILYPKIRMELSEDLVQDQFRLKINQLRGPILSAAPGEGLTQDAAPSTSESGHCMRLIEGELSRKAWMFLTSQQVQALLTLLNQYFPMLGFNVCERLRLQSLTELLRMLLEEGVGIRNLRGILEALLQIDHTGEWDVEEEGLVEVAEVNHCPTSRALEELESEDYLLYVREKLVEQIVENVRTPDYRLDCPRLPQDLLQRILVRDRVPASEDETDALWAELEAFLKIDPNAPLRAIRVPTMMRRKVWELLRREYPDLLVTSEYELRSSYPGRPGVPERQGWNRKIDPTMIGFPEGLVPWVIADRPTRPL